MEMDWHNLYFGHVSPQEVREAVKDPTWQALRRSLKGLSLQEKYDKLMLYKENMWKTYLITWAFTEHWWRMVEVRLTNYVTALSRGGLIKPEDYR